MSRARVNIDHRDILQQHYKKYMSTISYDLYDSLNEKWQAMDAWTAYLKSIL